MFGLGMGEIVLIVIVAIVLFGTDDLPKNLRKMAKGVNEFKKVASDAQRSWIEVKDDVTRTIMHADLEKDIRNSGNNPRSELPPAHGEGLLPAPDGHTPEGTLAYGHSADGHSSDGHPADGHPADGHPADGHPADGHPADGHTADGHTADGKLIEHAQGEASLDWTSPLKTPHAETLPPDASHVETANRVVPTPVPAFGSIPRTEEAHDHSDPHHDERGKEPSDSPAPHPKSPA